jgi:hypothetical protein
MRAKEFIQEAKQGKLSKEKQDATAGLHLFHDAEKANSDYVMFRLGMALACADGTNPVEIDTKTWIGKQKSAHPYTDIEQKMLKQVYKIAGADYEDLNNGDLHSKEPGDTNTLSPVSNWNKK